MNISVIIPVYKNHELFLNNFRHNWIFLQSCEVIIIDDGPDTSLQKELTEFHRIQYIKNSTHLGFGGSINQGVKHASRDLILLLNSDVLLQNNSFKKATVHFDNHKVFAVSFAQKEKDNAIVGKNRIYWKKGMMFHSKSNNLTFGKTAWAEGGSCIIDKKKFIQLGGFDSLYSPFYWEDIDLSYRAWKSGFEIIFDPGILVNHYHESTIGKYFQKNYIQIIAYRNQLIFIWKNISDISFIAQYLIYLPYHVLYFLVKRQFSFIKGFFQALILIPTIIKTKKTIPAIKSDYQIVQYFYET